MKETVLITGASSGIGLAFCKEYAKQGYDVVLVARSIDRLKEISLSLENEYNIKTFVIAKDLADTNSAIELFEELIEKKLSIDVLINNAGINNGGEMLSIPLKKIQQEMALNMVALTELSYVTLCHMVERKKGTLINIASIASFSPTPYESVYGATKAYVLSLTESLNYEYRKFGIKVIAICPGITKTNLFSGRSIDFHHARTPEQVVNTTLRALASRKHVVVDGMRNKFQSMFPRLFTRKFVLSTTGKSGGN